MASTSRNSKRQGRSGPAASGQLYPLILRSACARLEGCRPIRGLMVRDAAEFIIGPRFARTRWRLLTMRALVGVAFAAPLILCLSLPGRVAGNGMLRFIFTRLSLVVPTFIGI